MVFQISSEFIMVIQTVDTRAKSAFCAASQHVKLCTAKQQKYVYLLVFNRFPENVGRESANAD
jgi:hypothetical protein